MAVAYSHAVLSWFCVDEPTHWFAGCSLV